MSNNQNQPKNQPQIQIKITDDVLRGVYANAMQVIHTPEEFVLDFMNLSPHQGVGIVNSRVIISPGHLKRIIAALQDNIAKYEATSGKIQAAESPSEIGFN